MPARPIGSLRDLPRRASGSHRRGAIERAIPARELHKRAAEEPHRKLPPLATFERSFFWWNWLKDYSAGVFRGQADFPRPGESSIVEMPDSTNLAILGDWATGTDEARIIASIAGTPDYTIHIGDVYYVGSEEYIEENCLGIRQKNGYDPVKFPIGTRASFAMNGNHEAYAGDFAYFDWISKHLNQPSSCFCLHNDHWAILGLDTGYNSKGIPWLGWLGEQLGWSWLMPSCTLPDAALEWISMRLQPLVEGERGLILLTHHQPFSAFDNEYPNTAKQLSGIRAFQNRKLLWLWGHEHRLAGYDLSVLKGLELYGRCLGHGGMPVERGQAPREDRSGRNLLFYDDRSYDPQIDPRGSGIVARDTDFGVNGFARLTLAGPTATISYVDISGAEIISESWRSSGGSLVPAGAWATGPTVQMEGTRIVVGQTQ
ncbi:MAG: metallophosphoesterase [Acidobacteria bacterium]|nr:metallophosphoesterase [Acidobacteriota bacterium]